MSTISAGLLHFTADEGTWPIPALEQDALTAALTHFSQALLLPLPVILSDKL